MDFTYFFAGILAALIGLIFAIIFVVLRGRSFRRVLAFSIVVSIAADFALLLDWSRASEMTAIFLATDFLAFFVYSLVGCAVGIAPVIWLRRLFRLLKRQGYI